MLHDRGRARFVGETLLVRRAIHLVTKNKLIVSGKHERGTKGPMNKSRTNRHTYQ